MIRDFIAPRLRPGIRCTTAILLLELVAGCSVKMPNFPQPAWGGWFAGYDDAVKKADKSDRGLLVYFRTTNVGQSDEMFDAVRAGLRAAEAKDLVHCSVFASHEPDRRFVRQYGVQRAPALIVVHRDGTYHAAEGPRSSDQVADFLRQAQPPGSPPRTDAYLPQEVTYDWHSSLEGAQAAARDSNRSIFLVLDRRLSRDWYRLQPMIECRDVHARAANMVHCRPGAGILGGVAAAAQTFEVANLPAIVLIRPDGSHQSLEFPTSSDAIARFVDAAKIPEPFQP